MPIGATLAGAGNLDPYRVSDVFGYDTLDPNPMQRMMRFRMPRVSFEGEFGDD
jgi:hypothetical protein